MTTHDVERGRPLSPPTSSNGEIFQHGFHHLIQHNNNTSFPREFEEEGRPDSAYGSPAMAQPEDGYQYGSPPPQYTYHQHQDSGVNLSSYDGFSSSYPAPSSAGGSLYHYGTPADSPQPSMYSPESEPMRTRSGLPVHGTMSQRNEPKSRPAKVSKPKKGRKDRVKAENKVAKLDKPLSELTKDWKHIAVVDIEAYVNRSADERRKEIETGKNPGKIKRPMNSFMLYRKAYQNRTKDWCLQNNHQVVSQVCGDSWPLEPAEVRDQFNEWARLERINHQLAHPGYKFSPSKPGAAKVNNKRRTSVDLSDASDLEDFDWARGQTNSRRTRHEGNRSIRSSPYPNSPYHNAQFSPRGAYDFSRDSSIEPNMGSYNQSFYQRTNPGKPLPSPYNQSELGQGQYYQQSVMQNRQGPNPVEDVVVRKMAGPGMNYLGLPHGQDFDVGGNPYQSWEGTPAPEQRIDPSLLEHDSNSLYMDNFDTQPNGNLEIGPGGQLRTPFPPTMIPDLPYFNTPPAYGGLPMPQDQEMPMLSGQESWHGNGESLDAGQEFDKWMEERVVH